jgi:hypothetical protein
MRVQDVGLNGWYNLNVDFKIIEVQVNKDVRMGKCVDSLGKTFYLEIDETLLSNLSSSDLYYDIQHKDLEEIVELLHNTKNIFTLSYTSGSNKKSITGKVLLKDKLMGKTLIFSLKDGDEYFIDNRNILSLIVENVKYYAYEQETDI